MNIVDLIIGGLVLLALILAVRKIIRQKKIGGCYGCPGCSSAGECSACDELEAEAKKALQNNKQE